MKAGLAWLISICLLQSHRKKLSSPYHYKFQYDIIAAKKESLRKPGSNTETHSGVVLAATISEE